MKEHVRFLLSQQGPFAEKISGYQERESQMIMAEAVASAMENSSIELIEAGTGTGKTFAYLVPAMQFEGKTIIATGTRNLQDQLFLKDLPTVIRATGKTRKLALLKGRQNYLCLYRLESNLQSAHFVNKAIVEDIVKIREWSRKTTDGDLSQISFIQEDSAAIPFVTSTADNCLGSECSAYQDCFVAKARKHAMDSDIIVVNHHLLMADVALKRDGFGELLPKADAYIIDEAHQLPDIATMFFGQALSSRQLMELARDSEQAYRTEATDCPDLSEAAAQLEKASADLRIAMGEEVARDFWRLYRERAEIAEHFDQLLSALARLCDVLKEQAIRSRDLENLYERAEELHQKAGLFTEEDESEYVQWLEVYRKSFTLNATPLSIAQKFRQAMKGYKEAAWIMTSATLAVNEDFGFFERKLGLFDAQRMVLPSPFNYQEQALLYVPRYLKNPAASDYTQSFLAAMIPLMTIAKGRTFLLFTSHRALNEAAELLQSHHEFQLFVQGQASKAYLLEKFRKTPSSVLLGTFSFWEGVDVAGDALSLVAIDKLPFVSPGDPVNQARIDAMRREKRDAFGQFQLPDAIIALKQGAGRLIRNVTDRGVLVIGDPRIVGRQYGQKFLADLPPMIPTRNSALVEEFLSQL